MHLSIKLTTRINNIIRQKRSNLVLSCDVASTQQAIDLIALTGHLLLGVKLHSDIIKNTSTASNASNASNTFLATLKDMAAAQNFIIIEDRKFCDIGSTVQRQMENIAWYADLVTVHGISGAGVIQGLRSECEKHECGILLLAEMSSKDNLIDSVYTERVIQMARENSDIVVGFIGQRKYDQNFFTFTPGVHKNHENITGDNLGQQYNSPEYLVTAKNVDVVIVGRAIYQSDDPVQACKDHIFTHRMSLQNQLKETGVIKHGDFTLKSGEKSSVYADFRLLLGHPSVMSNVAKQFILLIDPNPDVLIVGVPLGALPLSSIVASMMQRKMIMIRDKPKNYGRQNQIEGLYNKGQHCVVIEDVLTSGGSVLDTVHLLEENGLHVDSIVAILDREKGAIKRLESEGYPTTVLFTLSELG